jgi:23S rRNA pseudouridine2457 synthase
VLILLNKPFKVLSQFRDADGRATLGDYVDVPGVYPAGRLDFDSEGLLLLTDDGALQARISQPKSGTRKTYWAQVEGTPSQEQLDRLVSGVTLKDGSARAVSARQIAEPAGLWPRDPPIRYRASIPDNWIEIVLTEGRNRQVRRMTAAVGLPTLRLIRYSVGDWNVAGLQPGEWKRA